MTVAKAVVQVVKVIVEVVVEVVTTIVEVVVKAVKAVVQFLGDMVKAVTDLLMSIVAWILRQNKIAGATPTTLNRSQRGRQPTQQKLPGLITSAQSIVHALITEHPRHQPPPVMTRQHPGTG